MQGTYKKIKWSDTEDGEEYLIVYKKGYERRNLTNKIHLMTKEEMVEKMNYANVMGDIFDIEAIIELDAYLTLLFKEMRI